jgi:flagellar hook-length control protein FliK
MTIAISGSLSTPSSVAEPVSASSAVTQRKPKAAAPADVETVKLSQASQVRLLKQQGQSLSQIASNLSIPMATVDSFLGIQIAKPAASSVPPQGQGPVVASQPPGKG